MPAPPSLFTANMKISELLLPATVVSDLAATSKTGVLSELAALLVKVHPTLDYDQVLQVLQERETLGSTGIGEGVAIPHGKIRLLDHMLMCFGRHRDGVDFDSMDGRPAHLFFLLLAPEEAAGAHLKALARISKLLRSPGVTDRLLAAGDQAELYSIIIEVDDQL